MFKSSFQGITILFMMCIVFGSSPGILAQKGSRDLEQIKNILFQQQQDWNNGNIDAFMDAYWNSEELQFGNANGIIYDWEKILDDYKVRYPDRETMGTLSFQIIDISRQSRKVVSLTGSWELEREHDRPGGHFLLIWRKIKGNWKIVIDHTSQREPASQPIS